VQELLIQVEEVVVEVLEMLQVHHVSQEEQAVQVLLLLEHHQQLIYL
jgi:hypothetical protein